MPACSRHENRTDSGSRGGHKPRASASSDNDDDDSRNNESGGSGGLGRAAAGTLLSAFQGPSQSLASVPRGLYRPGPTGREAAAS